MMHVFLNGLGASAASGLTYLRNVLPHLSRREDVRTTVAAGPRVRAEFACLSNVELVEVPEIGGAARRFWFEQSHLPELIRRSGAEVLISAGNFALRKSPVPQILLSGNSLYTSQDFSRDLRRRGEYLMWAETRARARVAKSSVRWADCTVAPTRAFADELQRWTGRPVAAIHHGFDREVFFGGREPLAPEVRQKLDAAKDCVRLLHVSHYNYFRNFETLLRALPLIKQQMPGKKIRLVLTCKLQDGENPGAYKTGTAAALVQRLGISEEVVELGAVPYPSLHQVYRACDLYVTASYAETFAHPVVEAMASGLPVVASGLAVHREVCGGAARYFPRFSPEKLAENVMEIMASKEIVKRLIAEERSAEFSWRGHVEQLLQVAGSILSQAARDRTQSSALAQQQANSYL